MPVELTLGFEQTATARGRRERPVVARHRRPRVEQLEHGLRVAWPADGEIGIDQVRCSAQRAGLAFDAALQRALPAAVVGYVLTWIVALATWRHLAAAELEVARQRILALVHELQAEAEMENA